MTKRAYLRMPDMVKKRKNGVDYVGTAIGPKNTLVYIPVIFKSAKDIKSIPTTPYPKLGGKIREGMNKRQAGETLKQLGGNRFIMMTGAKNFAVGPKGMGFKIGRNSKKINYIRIDLDRGKDLYNMEIIRMARKKGELSPTLKVVKKIKGVYADQLRDLFTKYTGMYTSL